MAIRTLSSRERYSNKNIRGGTEPRRKLKKLRSVKVANLDRLRLSMRRERTWFDPGSPSESSSSAMSGTSSPNYMKATTSWVARKASSSSLTTPERRNSSASRGKSGSKLSNVSVEQCFDPADEHIPVDIKSGKNLRKVAGMNRSKKLSSMKSMKIRAKYSQFPDVGINELGSSDLRISEFGDNADVSDDQDGMARVKTKQKGFLERSLSRSRSIRLTRLKSVRSSRRTKSRFGGEATVPTTSGTQTSNAEQKDTSSQEARKHPVKGLTRTSNLRSVRTLAKIPSLRTRRSEVRKRPQVAPLQGISIDRATCSSVLKTSNFPDHIQLNSGGLESEVTSSFHVCPYNYCSLHSHHHDDPSPPLKEFLSAKRQSAKNQKGKQPESQSKEAVIHSWSVTETNQVEQIVEADSPALKEVITASTANYPEAEDSGMDFLIKVYAKPRKKWAIEGSPREDAGASKGLDHTLFRYYDWKLEDTIGDTRSSKAKDEALNEGKLGFGMHDVELSDKTQQQTTKFAVPDSSVKFPDNSPKSSCIESERAPGALEDPSHISSTDSETSSRGDLINILSDEQKYSSIWHLIYQQFVSSEEPMAGNHGIKSPSEDGDNEGAVMEKVDFDQTAAVKLVQEALDAILQCDGQSSHQQAIQDQEMPLSPGEEILIPAVMSEENFRDICEVAIEKPSLESGYKMHKVEQEVEPLQQKAESDEETRPVRNRYKSLSKLRKMIVTAKFIKAMEKLRKISPGKPRYLSSEPTSEEERVHLMQPSMNEQKNVEEWMLDFALRKVISRLGPDEQRRVAILVKAFETLTPDSRERSIKCYHVKGEADPGIELATPKNEETEITEQPLESKQQLSISDEPICKTQDGVSPYHKGIPDEGSLREGQRHETCSTGAKILHGADETGILLESSGHSTTSIDRAFEEPVMGNEVSLSTPEAPFRLPVEDSEVNPPSDISTVLFDKNRYTSMWNMIYQHVISTEALMEGNNQGSDVNTSQEMNDQDSTQSSYSTEREEDEDNQSASCEKHESNQSAAIKLVKEAVNAILQRYELSSDQQTMADQNKATDDVRGLYIPTPAYSTEERCRGGDKRVTTPSEPEILEKKIEPSLHQVEDHGPKEPHKKMSKSLSKLKRAIVTAKFIKAMERLRKINPQKTQHLFPEAATEEERVYLRHLSINGRKNTEEWMLDYALRQVISKLAPDQRKRVALLVEAFETVTPEQKENSAECFPLNEEPATGIRLANQTNKELKQLLHSEQEISIFDEKVPQKQEDGFPLSHECIPAKRILQKDNDHRVSRTDDKTQPNIDKRTVSSTFERSKNDSISAYADVNVEELSSRDADTTITSKVTSPRGDSKAGIAVDMTTILSDEQKYTSMWQLIYQHTVPSQASTVRKQRHNKADEDEQDEDANNGEEMNYLDSIESTERTNQTENENNQTEDGKEQELESAAIKLVKEAIKAILQSHEMRSDDQFLQEHDTTVDGGGDLHNKAVSASTEGNSIRWKAVGKHRNSEREDKLHTVVNENALVQKKVEANKLKTSQGSSPRSFNKLRKVFLTAKFMKAMERMRRISPRQPRFLSPEAAPEEERVNLTHQDINEQRNAEEWMLDYALRKVISNLSPEQQRRVASLVEAFETVTQDQKYSGIRSHMKAELSPDIDADSTANGKRTIEYEHNKCTSYDDHIWPNTGDIGKGAQQKRSPGEEHPIKISNFKAKLREEVLGSDGNNLHGHHHTSLKGCLVYDTPNIWTERKETDPNSKSEPLQGVSLSVDSKQDHEADVTKGIFPGTQNHTSMWHLIYQHAKSATAAEAENLSGKVPGKDDLKRGNASSEMSVDADADDSDASSVTSELTESEAVKLVREAISDILSEPQELDNELLCSKDAAASDEDQTAGEGEKAEKTLSRGYSKLRKLIICNKFIKAMEKAKMRKSYPQKCRNRTLNADPEPEKINLKPSTEGGKKNAEELLLDHALQKVIAGLAPVQQRRVALLVEAFEKVKPDTEEAGKRFSSNGTTYLPSAGNAKERKEQIFESSQGSSQLPDGFNFKLQGLLTTSSREVVSDSALAEVHKEKTPIISRDNWRNDSPSSITGTTPDVKGTQSNDCKDTAEFNPRDTHYWPLQHEEVTSVDLNYSEPAAETAENPSEPEDLEKGGNPRTENDMAFDKVRHTSLWSLLVQHVTTDIFEETETQITGESDSNANDQYQLASEVNYDDYTNVQMPKSTSFELQEKEAIKVVQEALDAILTCDDQSTMPSDTSDQDCSTENQGRMGEPSPETKEIEGDKNLVDSVMKPIEEQRSEENLSSSCNKLSQVILCKRFIKAMDKMRKLKPQAHSQQLQSDEKIVHRIRQNASNQGKNWEQWMLDHAMQQVVGNLAPAQKKKVSLLVQAFEKVSSQPEPGTGQKGKARGF